MAWRVALTSDCRPTYAKSLTVIESVTRRVRWTVRAAWSEIVTCSVADRWMTTNRMIESDAVALSPTAACRRFCVPVESETEVPSVTERVNVTERTTPSEATAESVTRRKTPVVIESLAEAVSLTAREVTTFWRTASDADAVSDGIRTCVTERVSASVAGTLSVTARLMPSVVIASDATAVSVTTRVNAVT